MRREDHRGQTWFVTEVLAEPESIISFAIARGIKEHPDQAAAQMLELVRENARLEAELFFLRQNLLTLARIGVVVDP